MERYLEDLELWFDVQIDWLGGVVAAVALLPRSHIDLPTSLARGSYAREMLRLNQMCEQMKHCRKRMVLCFGDGVAEEARIQMRGRLAGMRLCLPAESDHLCMHWSID